MEERVVVELSVVSAREVRGGRVWGRVRAYAVVRIEPFAVRTTHTDDTNGSNPLWNATFTFTLPAFFLRLPNRMVVVDVFSKGCISDAKLGTAVFPIADIIHHDPQLHFLTHRLLLTHRRPHRRPHHPHHPTLTISSRLPDPPPPLPPPLLHTKLSGVAFGTVADFSSSLLPPSAMHA